METKAEIRKRILEVRKGLTDREVRSKSEAIVQKVIKTPEYREAGNVLLYADYCREVMTRGIFEDALLHRKKIYFPRVDKARNTMLFFQVISVRQLVRGYMDILEPREDNHMCYEFQPKEDTLAILPGVVFDTAGYRIGYGKGFYDRFLADKRQISTMALAYSCQIIDEIPRDAHDIKMDKVVTEEIIYSFLRI
ncbi:MAG: 5-formyltetrahydrofolate cyclo-ligase [Lachnospiraceae bacterium]|nr:5-formyltetrahydrofolate cyclo-ligase [Lachnospiraceae bacterium]MDE7031437.1 5-formyltetrahydrofolate cyclo-ligase [Lachnospiraceae bacterium]